MNTDLNIENIPISIYKNPADMGTAAADFVAHKLNEVIALKGKANLILATGSSQFTFLEALTVKEIDWQKITVFHLDEYKGISSEHPASFRKYLKDRILDAVNPKKVFLLKGDTEDVKKVIQEYTDELKKHPIDLACIGIGENGHIAFNDPPVADFNDSKWVKLVALDEACKNQQIGEGWFSTMDDVPKQALTLTITAILNCKTISCVVPDERKAQAVYNTLYQPISTECPATILRKHTDTRFFLDRGAASKL